MPPKVSKKTEQKAKAKVIEDKTFGLKNKNKSKAVQKYIQAVTANVQNAGTKQAKAEEKKRQERNAARLAKKQQEEELNALFGAALAVSMKKKSIKNADEPADDKNAEADVKEERKLTAQEQLEKEQKERAEAKGASGPVYEQTTFFVAEETKTIENFIEEKRAELAAKGLVGTPVTEESFAQWKEGRRLRRLEENAKKVQEEQKKKKGGKGLSVLSGKALFEYDPTLFVDDDEAMDRNDEVQYPRNLDAEIDDGDDNGAVGEHKEAENGAVHIQEGLFAEGDDELDDIDDDDEEQDDEDSELRVNRTDGDDDGEDEHN